MSSYEDAAKTIDPFYDAYIATSPDTKGLKIFFGIPTIKNGVDGYKNAAISRNNGGVTSWFELYYQAPGKDWKFFLGGQNSLACDKFNTITLKKSFVGTACYDANGLSKVKAD